MVVRKEKKTRCNYYYTSVALVLSLDFGFDNGVYLLLINERKKTYLKNEMITY